MKYLTIFFLIAILIFPLASAETTLGTFKQNDCVRLLQACADCTYVNITSVNYPNSTQALGHVPMTKIGTEFNYTFCSTSSLGTYIVNGVGNEAGIDTVWAYDFAVTVSGYELTTAQGILYIIGIAGLTGMLVLCLFGAIVIPYGHGRNEEGKVVSINDMKYLKIVCIFLVYATLMFLTGMINSVMNNYLLLNIGGNFFYYFYSLLYAGIWPAMIIALFSIVVNLVDGKKIRQAIERGVDIR